MNQRAKTVPNSNLACCEKYLNHVFRQDRVFVTKRSQMTQRQPPGPRPRPKTVSAHASVPQKHVELPTNKFQKPKQRSISTCRSRSRDRAAWKNILHENDQISSFQSFDPLRTIHFLSQELHTKLQSVLPEEDGVLQMVADISHALKRIPPELASLLNIQLQTKTQEFEMVRPPHTNKSCQTPLALSQDDTEKFKKIMDENTHKLEASCKQLEMVCTNLQNEKDVTEQELEEAKENLNLLCRRVKEMEHEIEQLSNGKIKQLETDKQQLQKELNVALTDARDGPSLEHFKSLVMDLKTQKFNSEENCIKLQYELTLLKMEREKLLTMLSLRDREIKDIQDEMAHIQEQVNKELNSLQGNMLKKVSSMKALPDGLYDNHFFEIGDATISSIKTNEFERDHVNVAKESPMGDAGTAGLTQQARDADKSLLTRHPGRRYQELLEGLSPPCKDFLTSDNV